MPARWRRSPVVTALTTCWSRRHRCDHERDRGDVEQPVHPWHRRAGRRASTEAFLSAVILLLALFIARYGDFLRQEFRPPQTARRAAELSAHQDVVTGLPRTDGSSRRQVATTLATFREATLLHSALTSLGLQDLYRPPRFHWPATSRQAAARASRGAGRGAIIQSKLEGDCFAFLIARGNTDETNSRRSPDASSPWYHGSRFDGRTIRLGTFLSASRSRPLTAPRLKISSSAHVSLDGRRTPGSTPIVLFDP